MVLYEELRGKVSVPRRNPTSEELEISPKSRQRAEFETGRREQSESSL